MMPFRGLESLCNGLQGDTMKTMIALVALAAISGCTSSPAPDTEMSVPVAHTLPSTPPPTWSYRAEKDQMSNGVNRFASIDSINSVNFASPYAGEQHASLIVRSMADNHGYKGHYDLMITIDRGQLLGGDQGGIKARLNDTQAVSFEAETSDDNDSTVLFFQDTLPKTLYRNGTFVNDTHWPLQEFIANMQQAKTMKVQVTAYQNGDPVFIFNIGGFSLTELNSVRP